MEYIWYIIAATGAGIGTGLAGLSAATVMVPILIVLCPSFSGETGAYQATAIALASDILGSAVTTASSLISASFANRVSNRTVGLVTGIVLTILGAFMIYLNYRDSVFAYPLVQYTLITLRNYLKYIISLAAILIILHFILPIPKDVFRKLLHVAAFTSSIFIVFNGKGWLPGTITLVIFSLIVYPALKIAESWQGYAALFVEKKPGEIRSSLLLLFLSQAAITAFSGIVGKPYILVVSTAAWGLGDIAAAWVGRPLGRHKINLPFADHKKSWEGSIAMALTAFAASLPALLALTSYQMPKAILIALIIAVISSLTEMSSKGGLDTVTVPVANAIVLWIITLIL